MNINISIMKYVSDLDYFSGITKPRQCNDHPDMHSDSCWHYHHTMIHCAVTVFRNGPQECYEYNQQGHAHKVSYGWSTVSVSGVSCLVL